MDIVFEVLKLAGALGLFLFGMKMMSEGLQKLAGDRMRAILSAMTSNSIKRVLTGVLITAVIQSSSATTVMIVSFVNAGLLTLTQSVGVIMGANIGTTVTAWIISLLGFKADISILAIPLIAVGFPFLMVKSRKKKSVGEFIIGFSLLFMGLTFLKDSVPMPDINNPPEIFEVMKNYSRSGFFSVLLFVGIGTLLTIILQSSSATMALTMVMCNNGWIPFEVAVAMVMGENIGTTITANIAAAVANVQAKRAARAHLLFNVVGVVWMLTLFHPVLKLIEYIILSFGGASPYNTIADNNSILIGLSLFHTMFNLINTCLLIGFTPWIVKIVTRMVPQKSDEDKAFRLQYISSGMLSVDELSQTQAKLEIVWYAKRCIKQFGLVKELFRETNEEKFDELYKKIEHDEEVSDRIELEIATYLNKISESELSEEGGRRIQAMYKIISEIESISDSNYTMSRTLLRKKNLDVWFEQDMRDNINAMLELLDKALDNMMENLEKGYENIVDIGNAYECENAINDWRNQLKDGHIQSLDNNRYKYVTGVVYMDFIMEAEQMGDYIVNVSEAVMELRHGL
jgi:phosphate:Na+ symporter